MAGRNDRRRSNDLRSEGGRSRTRQTSHTAGTSRPGGGQQRTASPSRGSRKVATASTMRNREERNQVEQTQRPSATRRSSKSTKVQVTASKQRPRASTRRQATATHIAPKDSQSLQADAQQEVSSTSVGELRRADRMRRARKNAHGHVIRIMVAIGVVAVLVVGWVFLYNSSAFTIENVRVNGVEHLTSDEMAQLANVPADSTLLRVDTATIESRIEKNAWVADAQVNLVYPDTIEINVTERPIFAVVEILTGSSATVKQWLIAEDHVWLMPVPDATSEAAKTTSSKVYEDAGSALHIKDVPFGTKAAIGEVCSDANVNNALDILSGLTTELANRVVEVSAAGTAETTLVLDNGVEVAFGKAENIRDKERVVLQILNENEDNVSYINVRIVDSPTWRSV